MNPNEEITLPNGQRVREIGPKEIPVKGDWYHWSITDAWTEFVEDQDLPSAYLHGKVFRPIAEPAQGEGPTPETEQSLRERCAELRAELAEMQDFVAVRADIVRLSKEKESLERRAIAAEAVARKLAEAIKVALPHIGPPPSGAAFAGVRELRAALSAFATLNLPPE